MIARLLALLVLLATTATAAASGPVPGKTIAPTRITGGSSVVAMAASLQPRPLGGVPIAGSTGLRLLVANVPPFVLDVDSGRITRISGLTTHGHPVLTVHGVGKDAIVWLDPNAGATKAPRAEIFVVRRGTTIAIKLATAWEVAPSADGAAVWLKSYADAQHCTLRKVALDGNELRGPRAVPCSTQLLDAGGQAVLVEGSSILDPDTRENLLDAPRLWARVGNFAVTTERSQGLLTLTDLRSGERWRLRYPSKIRGQGGIDEAAVQRTGKLAALSFADPAYQFSGTQVIDVWLLDPALRRFRHLPDMPAAVSLKRTSMSWTSDGRLVMLAESNQRNVVAVWRPGQKRIRVRPVRLPARNSGSDAFVVWRTARSR
jgi:hypothetical protein